MSRRELAFFEAPKIGESNRIPLICILLTSQHASDTSHHPNATYKTESEHKFYLETEATPLLDI